MAQKVTTTPLDGEFPDIIAQEAEANTTASEDMMDGPRSIVSMVLDNSGNATDPYVYYRLYDALTADPSTDVPPLKIRVPASTKRDIIITDGLAFSVGLTLRATSATGDTDTTAPTTPGPAFFVGS